uniref:Uncharacterized protein n=1 Tax=Amphimedon queenslandica TaxID=400682 RepID=A0A1X7TSU4_AMPQE
MDRNVDGKDQYKFNWRARHTTAIVREVLYCWGGDQGLDESECDCSGDFPKKRQHISVIDEFDFSSGVWSSQPTSGTPPLGIRGVSCTTINNNIYYFGGFCGHGKCYHNSLNCLDTLNLQWKELQPTGNDSVTKKGYGGMIAMGSEGEPQQLLVIGGLAPISTTTEHHQFEYHKIPSRDDRLRTNEHNIYNLSSGQWIVPFVSGQCFPPTDNFTVERINHNKGIMYGGSVTDGGKSVPTSSIYLFQLSCNTINWESLSKGAIPNDGLWTKGRYAHASTIINGVSTSPTLVVIGGIDSNDKPVNEYLLFDTNQYNWMKIPVLDSVTGRYYHTVSPFVVDPNHVFLIIVGGYAKKELVVVEGEMEWMNKPVTYPNITMVVELVFNDGQWSVGPVLDSHNIPLLYEQILKERRKQLIGMNEYMTEEFIEKKRPQAKLDLNVYFRIASPNGFVELNLNAPQDEPFTGWSIKPHMTPCRLFQKDIYNFGNEDYPLPPSCRISVYSSPDAVPTLHYSVPVEGVADPLTLNIHRTRRTSHPIADVPSASSSDEAKPVTTKRRRAGSFDIKTAKQKIKQVMNENHSDFADILESSLKDIANKLFEAKIVAQQVQKSPTYDAIASSFLSLMKILDSKSALEKHCMMFLEALSSVGGPIERVAECLQEKWTAALGGALQFEQSVKRVRTNDDV